MNKMVLGKFPPGKLAPPPVHYGCSFVAKLSWKKNFVFWKNIYIFYKIYVICSKKMFLYAKKKILEKNTNENVKKYISFQKYIFTQKMFVLQTKYKSFLNIYSFC